MKLTEKQLVLQSSTIQLGFNYHPVLDYIHEHLLHIERFKTLDTLPKIQESLEKALNSFVKNYIEMDLQMVTTSDGWQIEVTHEIGEKSPHLAVRFIYEIAELDYLCAKEYMGV